MRKNKGDYSNLLIILALIVIVGSVIFFIWAMATYGGKPVSEVPSWVHWLMFK